MDHVHAYVPISSIMKHLDGESIQYFLSEPRKGNEKLRASIRLNKGLAPLARKLPMGLAPLLILKICYEQTKKNYRFFSVAVDEGFVIDSKNVKKYISKISRVSPF